MTKRIDHETEDALNINDVHECTCGGECGGNCGENCKCHHHEEESISENLLNSIDTEICLKTINGKEFTVDGMGINWDNMIENIPGMLGNIDTIRSMLRDLMHYSDDEDALSKVIINQINVLTLGMGIELTYDQVNETMSLRDMAICMCFDTITILYELLNVTNAQMVMSKTTNMFTDMPKGWRLEPTEDVETSTGNPFDIGDMFAAFNVRMYENGYVTTELDSDAYDEIMTIDVVRSDSDEDGEFLEIVVMATDADEAITKAEAAFETYYEQKANNKEEAK